MQLEVNIEHCQGSFKMQCAFTCRTSALGVFGPSGSGKSTLLRAITGLIRPVSGTIRLDGRTLFDSHRGLFIPPHQRGIGVVFQDARLFPHWNVERNLRAGEINPERLNQRAFSFDEITALLNIRELLTRRVKDLSGGERQRIAIGRALLANPSLLLLDEPLNGVDESLKSQILPFFSMIHEQLKIPAILVSHALIDILTLTGNLLLLKNGRVVAHDTLSSLIESPDSLSAFDGSELTNLLTGRVLCHQPDSGITLVELTPGRHVKISLCGHIPEGTEIRMGIHANQIALAPERIPNISMRNQLLATLRRVIHSERRSICSLECCGSRIFAEITPGTEHEIKIGIGGELWILFKSASVRRAGSSGRLYGDALCASESGSECTAHESRQF